MASVPLIGPDDVERELEPRHREVMLDLILTWASLDGALAMLLAVVLGISHYEAADKIGKWRGSEKFRNIYEVIKIAPNGTEAARIIKKHKKDYEKYSKPRNRIAHSRCAGLWRKDRDCVVFAVYEREGKSGLAVEAVPIQEMRRAIKWGEAMIVLSMKLVDAAATAK